MLDGVDLIANERNRQITQEGYRPEDDDRWTEGELAEAAAAYVLGDVDYWPFAWDSAGYKANDSRERQLEKAGALIAAELDRLRRANGPQ